MPGLFVVLLASTASAQPGLATIQLTVVRDDGSPAPGAQVDLTPDGAGLTRTVSVDGPRPTVVSALDPGRHRIQIRLAGLRAVDQEIELTAGLVHRISVRLVSDTGPDRSTLSVDGRWETAYQTSLAQPALSMLPSSGTVWSLLETAHPFLISDRMDNGGLWSARPALMSGWGMPWNQTTYRIGGVDVSDPRDRSGPAIYPDLAGLQHVQVDGALMAGDVAGPGAAITLVPRQPGREWAGSGQLLFTPGSFQPAAPDTGPPAAARFGSWTDASAVAHGPLTPRAGMFASARRTSASRTERRDPLELSNQVTSLYGHAIAAAGAGTELRLLGAFSSATRPFAGRARFANRNQEERGRSVLTQATVDRVAGAGLVSLTGSYLHMSVTPQVDPFAVGGTIERLLDGPPLTLAEYAETASRRWTVSTAITPALPGWQARGHRLRFGADVSGAAATSTGVAQPSFGELVNGVPARVWDVRWGSTPSRWSSTSVGAFAAGQFAAGRRVTVDGSLRFDFDRGSADGASGSISWTTLMPRLSARWVPRDAGRLAITTGYAGYGNRLPLDYLRVGDPAAPSGRVYRWDDRNADRQFVAAELTPVAEVGTCCAGGVAAAIDPDLRRPTVWEFFVGVEHGVGPWRWRIAGLDRREHNPVALVNTGIQLSDYTRSFVLDPGIDIAGTNGFTPLPIFGRTPAMFGRDRYELTNPDWTGSRYQGVEITVDRSFARRWFFRFGGSAHRGKGLGMNRGYRSDENDQGLLGEAFLNPNATTSVYGRPFFDRGYIMKVSGAYHAPGDVRVGVVARYQDGQPFSRLVLADGLYQGRDFVQAIPRGGQRFTYVFTLDARVEKDIAVGGRRVGLLLEAFNLTDSTLEVEEDVVTGPAFRTITVVQPPRAIRVGVRVGF